MMNLFIFTILDPKVKNLDIFCDSCSGQNKNYLVIKFCHYVVYIAKRLDSIKITFPVRGHSYMDCDRNMALINQTYTSEIPEDWIIIVQNARVKPSPFKVVDIDVSFFKDWNSFLEPLYTKKCPFATRPIRQIVFKSEHSRLVEHRAFFNGHWTVSPIRPVSMEPVSMPHVDFTRKEFVLPAVTSHR